MRRFKRTLAMYKKIMERQLHFNQPTPIAKPFKVIYEQDKDSQGRSTQK